MSQHWRRQRLPKPRSCEGESSTTVLRQSSFTRTGFERVLIACSVALFQRWALTAAHAGYCAATPERRAYALISLSVTRLMQRLGAVKKRGLKTKAAVLPSSKVGPGMKNRFFLFSVGKREFLVLVPFSAAACVSLAYVFKKAAFWQVALCFQWESTGTSKEDRQRKSEGGKNKRQGAWHEQARYLLSTPRDGQGLKKQDLKRQYKY